MAAVPMTNELVAHAAFLASEPTDVRNTVYVEFKISLRVIVDRATPDHRIDAIARCQSIFQTPKQASLPDRRHE